MTMKRHDHFFIQHIRENMTVYIFLTTLFFIGIIFGAIIVNGLSFIQKQDIYFQFENFLNSLMSGEVQTKSAILKQSFIFHIKVLAILFLLGLTIIGIPIRSEEHTSELQSRGHLVCHLLLEKKNIT